MWPFSEMSLATASLVGTIANWGLLVSLLAGLFSTFVIVKTTDVKEEHWEAARRASGEQIGAAHADIAKANAQIAEAGKQTAALERETADARKAIAEANARAAEANQKAETERTERVKLELRIAPRSLTGQSEGLLSAQLADLAGMRVDLVVYESNGADIAPLAAQIVRSLTAAGLSIRVFTPFPDGSSVRGILVRSSDDAPEDIKAAVPRIVGALMSVGLISSTWTAFPAGEAPSSAYNGPSGLAPDAKIRLLIGAKP